MIVAIPLTETNEFSSHFGAAARVGLIHLEPETRTILKTWAAEPPDAEPCSWAPWLAALGVSTFFAGGMGTGAQERMKEQGITVIVGVPALTPQTLVNAWLDGSLTSGTNGCEGGHGHHEHHHHHHDHGHACKCSCSH